MTKIPLKWSGICALLLAIPSVALAGSVMDEISPAQQEQVKKGDQVLVTEDVAGNAWPRIRVYRIVNATPEEMAAVFFDFSNAKGYVPNLLKSEISKKVSPTVVDVDYGLDVPILPDEYYTTRNTLTVLPDGGYEVDWKLLRAVQTKDSVGRLRMIPYGDGKTLICYQNLVTPGSMMAGLLRGKAIQQMRDSVQAIALHVEKEKANDPDALNREVAALRDLLK